MYQTSWPRSFLGLSCLHSPSHFTSAQSQAYTTNRLSVGSGEPQSGPCTRDAIWMQTEPSLQPCPCFLVTFSSLQWRTHRDALLLLDLTCTFTTSHFLTLKFYMFMNTCRTTSTYALWSVWLSLPLWEAPAGNRSPKGSQISFGRRRGRMEVWERVKKMEVHSLHARHQTSLILDGLISGENPDDGVTWETGGWEASSIWPRRSKAVSCQAEILFSKCSCWILLL